MKILIATGIYPPDIGGPAYYAKSLAETFRSFGHRVEVRSYHVEKKLPVGIRHILYFLRIIFPMIRSEYVIALDTFSAGVPAVLAARLMGKPVVVRVGGDFLWEAYVNRTGEEILLSEFYKKSRKLSFKERRIYQWTAWLLRSASGVVFSTAWQKEIWNKAYHIPEAKIFVIENFYHKMAGSRNATATSQEKKFVWAGRDIPLKNISRLKEAFAFAQKQDAFLRLEIIMNMPHKKLMEKIQESYAVIIPSFSEVSPNMILEAIMLNKPFLCTGDTGVYDRLKDVGLFVDPLNVHDIAEKVQIISDEDTYKKYVGLLAQFQHKHSYEDIATEFLEVYNHIHAHS